MLTEEPVIGESPLTTNQSPLTGSKVDRTFDHLLRLRSFKLLEKLRKKNETIKAYVGLDLHNIFQLTPIAICTRENYLKAEEFLEVLKRGDYHIEKGSLYTVKPTTQPPLHWKTVFCVGNLIHDITSASVRLVAMWLRKLGVPVPLKVKNAIRRILG